ncbi:MAG: hypothetical protein ACRD0A_16870 [Acidimicrobiales bacterium]
MRRLLPVVVVVAVGVIVGCGSDDGDVVEAGSQATSTTSTTTIEASTTTIENGEAPVSGEISLTIRVASPGAELRDATLTCDEGRAEGTGFLEDPSAAQAACDLLTGDEFAVDRLVNGRAPGMMCTQQYGGPETAKVTGTIGGRRISATIDRTDGCGIAEWNLLTPLLGPPAT